MNRRHFLGGLLAACGLAKAGALGAEEVVTTVARIPLIGVDPAVEPYTVHFTSSWDMRAVHRDDYVFFADGR